MKILKFENLKSDNKLTKYWNAKYKQWDYKSDYDHKSNFKYLSKELLEDENSKDWFNPDYYLELNKIIEYKNDLKKQFTEIKYFNDFKKDIFFKRYYNFNIIEMIFYKLSKNYNNKNIYYYNDKLKNVYMEKPSLERLINTDTILVSDYLSKFSNMNYETFNYWIFKNDIIFSY